MTTENRTFTIIKPNAVEGNHIGEICTMIESAGFRIVAMKMTTLTKSQAQEFYHIHRGKPFFENLTLFMSSGAIVAMLLERDSAIEELRRLVGATDPTLAKPGTIRNLFAQSHTRNAIHASDSEQSVLLESEFFFSEREIIMPLTPVMIND